MDEEYVIQDLFKEYRYSLKKIKNKLKKINKFDNLGDSLIQALSEMFNNHFKNLLFYYDTYASDGPLESLCSRIEKFYSWKIMFKMNIFLLQSLSVEADSDFTWRTARLYQVGECIPVPGCI